MLIEVKGHDRSAKKVKYDDLFWNAIMADTNRRRKLAGVYNERALELLTTAAEPAMQEAQQAIQLYSARGTTNSHSPAAAATNDNHLAATATTDDHHAAAAAHEATGNGLFSFAERKFKGEMVAEENARLSTYMTQGRTIREKMINHAIHLLSKSRHTMLEKELIKLLLSGVINFLDHSTYEAMKSIFTTRQLDLLAKPDNFNRGKYGLDLPSIAMLNDIVDNSGKDLDSLLQRTQHEKTKLIINKERKSDTYKMLCILDIVAEYFDKPMDKNASETTVYRRFAMLLDFLFADLDVNMKDGEALAEATKSAMEQSDYDAMASHGKRIDLLLKIKDTKVELACNEWKTYSTSHLLLPQQSKNLRSNCAVLSKLHISSHGKINKVMAADVVGTTGYIYLLELRKDIYVATVIETMFLPADLSHLALFKKTIHALFIWKDFLAELVDSMKVALVQEDLDNMVRTPTSEPCDPPPKLFFTPKHNRKRSIDQIE
ncbi:hypothetical protein EC973_008496 [Apophysomyces ossiformis]|uniref:Uncharacterized protein n=1 Tax=Apophysomyces ossiformis TaxID=679940 RepID=A0A8H7EPT2_9FUNG|nr:hypothetical protein EC973_008496 [Apophysomyces ossiformis]